MFYLCHGWGSVVLRRAGARRRVPTLEVLDARGLRAFGSPAGVSRAVVAGLACSGGAASVKTGALLVT
ncbi:MAG: hypothetical protein ACREFQ_06220, partial [Stellaceae bacterium]